MSSMKDKILSSALIEFSENSFNEASLNSIVKRASISKGIIYHYFKNKDDLCMSLIQNFFNDLISYINQNFDRNDIDLKSSLHHYFLLRNKFFNAYPLYLNFYYNITSNPPNHLIENIKEVRMTFDQLNEKLLIDLLSKTKLHPDLTISDALESFKIFQEYIDVRYQVSNKQSSIEREAYIRKWLNIFLYGIVERGEN